MNVTKQLVVAIRHDLRDKRKESRYETSRRSGLRQEVIGRIEDGAAKSSPAGSSESLCRYIDSYCSRFPAEAHRMFYNLSMLVAKQQITFAK